MPPLTLISLNQRVQTLENYLTKIKIFITILSFLGIGVFGALAYIVKKAEAAKDKAVAARDMAVSAAQEADIILKEIEAIDIHKIMEELKKAENDYRSKSQKLDSLKKVSDSIVNNLNNTINKYNRMVKQLTASIDLYVPSQKLAKEKVYLKGYIFTIGESEQIKLEGNDVLKQRVWLTFDESTRSILPVLAKEETLKVKFLFLQ